MSILLLLTLSVGFVSCGDDEPDGTMEPDIIYLSSNDSQDITLRYDASETFNIIKFNATGDWIAEVYPANSDFQIVESKAYSSYSKVDWLEITPYAGTAGTWSCNLLSAPNHQTESRYAVVVLVSAKSKVRFEITQEGMPSGGGGSIIPNPGN